MSGWNEDKYEAMDRLQASHDSFVRARKRFTKAASKAAKALDRFCYAMETARIWLGEED